MPGSATEIMTRAAATAEAREGLRPIPAEEWDALLAPGQGGLRHGYLSAWERVKLRGLRARPLALHRDQSLVAAAPGYHYELDLAEVMPTRLAGAVRRLRPLWSRLLLLRVYELGGPVALSHPLLGVDSDGEAAALLLGEAIAEAERGGASLVIAQDFHHREGEVAARLAADGFLPVQIPSTVILELPFDSFDEYLGAMRAQYRRRARQAMKRSGNLRVQRREQFAELAPQLARLAQLVFRRATEIRREMLTTEYFRAASGDQRVSVLLLTREDESIASFALLLDDRPWLHFVNCGFEEAAGREEGAYFRLLYEIARLGIEEGFERVNLGTTTIPPKLDAGGVAVPLTAWARHRRPLMQRIAEVAAARLFPPRELEHRNVFRAPYDSAAARWAGRGAAA